MAAEVYGITTATRFLIHTTIMPREQQETELSSYTEMNSHISAQDSYYFCTRLISLTLGRIQRQVAQLMNNHSPLKFKRPLTGPDMKCSNLKVY